jgi:uncharacterized membrane protein YraQ (UPF0718 family)
LLGLLIGGLVAYLLPHHYIEYFLARKEKKTLFYAVGLGFLFSACSHGILAIAIQMYKKGASTASVITMLLASPWANLPMTILLFGFFGLNTLWLLGGAICTALITGWIFQILEHRELVEGAVPNSEAGFESHREIWVDIKERWQGYSLSLSQLGEDLRGIIKESLLLARMIIWWLVIGIVVAATVRSFLPHEWFWQYLGATPMGMGVTLLFATVLEVCSEGTAPLAFELYHQTHAFGNVFLFLLAGVVTDYTEIGLLWGNVGWRTAVALPLISVPQVILWGIFLNWMS